MNPIPDKHFSKFDGIYDENLNLNYPSGWYLVKLKSNKNYVSVYALTEDDFTLFEDWGGCEIHHSDIDEIALIRLD